MLGTEIFALILPADLLTGYERVADELRAVEIDLVHIDRGDLAVFVGGVIIDTPVGVAAARVNRVFKRVTYSAAALLLRDRA